VAGGLTRGWKRGEARAFLLAFLRGRPRPAGEVCAESRKLGLSERTLKRAKQDLGIRSADAYCDGVKRSYWLMPGQELPAGLRGPAVLGELEEWLAPLREKYPSRTPLDEG
jgi:hypothetical protein